MITVSSYIETAFSMDDVQKLTPVIEDALRGEEKVELDFSGVKYFTTLFFNNAITRYVVSLGPDKYRDVFKLLNLSEVGRTTYKHSLDNAIAFYGLPDDKKPGVAQIVSQTLQEHLD